eukprot:6414916-Pyramimonas_sp.AAC.1
MEPPARKAYEPVQPPQVYFETASEFPSARASDSKRVASTQDSAQAPRSASRSLDRADRSEWIVGSSGSLDRVDRWIEWI